MDQMGKSPICCEETYDGHFLEWLGDLSPFPIHFEPLKIIIISSINTISIVLSPFLLDLFLFIPCSFLIYSPVNLVKVLKWYFILQPTAILIACEAQNLDVVRMLVSAKPVGANVNLEAEDGRRPIW